MSTQGVALHTIVDEMKAAGVSISHMWAKRPLHSSRKTARTRCSDGNHARRRGRREGEGPIIGSSARLGIVRRPH